MVFDVISAHVQDVHDDLKKLASHLLDLPNAKSVTHVEGATTSIAGAFTAQLEDVALNAAKATSVVIEELNKTDSAIRAALDDLAAQEDEIALGADYVEASIQGSGHVAPPLRNTSSPGTEHIKWDRHSQGGTTA